MRRASWLTALALATLLGASLSTPGRAADPRPSTTTQLATQPACFAWQGSFTQWPVSVPSVDGGPAFRGTAS